MLILLTFSVAFSVVIVVVQFQIVRAVVERKSRRRAATCWRVGATVDDGVEVCLAEETVVSALAELVAGDKLPLTDDALEALDVVDLVPGSHHQVVLGESDTALRAPRPEQSTTATKFRLWLREKKKKKVLELFSIYWTPVEKKMSRLRQRKIILHVTTSATEIKNSC